MVAAVQEKTSLVQVGREQPVSALEPELVGEEWISMKISGAKKDGVNFGACSIAELNCVSLDLGQQRTLFDLRWPVVAHGFGPPSADDVFGAIFDYLKGDIFGRVRSADQQQGLSFELASIAEIVSVHNTASEPFNAGECWDMRDGIMTRGDDDVGEPLSWQRRVVFEVLNDTVKSSVSLL